MLQQRQMRKARLEELQRKAVEEEKRKRQSVNAAKDEVAGAATAATTNGDVATDQSIRTSTAKVGSSNAGGGGGGGYDSAEDEDDDAGPIEIVKQGDENEPETDNDNDRSNGDDAAVSAEGNNNDDHRNKKMLSNKENKNGNENGGGRIPAVDGKSSSELRAQQGKEDRPVFDMFSAASLTGGGGVGPGRMGAKGGAGQHNMSFLGDDGGGDQVRTGSVVLFVSCADNRFLVYNVMILCLIHLLFRALWGYDSGDMICIVF